ncbi:hypothetical protein B0P06_005273 [Clostridium saccharoperbutylacetonicum]|uniref:Phage gp6-like head-tail connector protein n=1 Tax=Clostridium saccharoperbutylacetonicum N1-4(HMT) TaxID=931276 RepID=M1MJF7_9CLOT|nr:hypothetical protein [Clostridium saccharoperbutylacetonicum]AGF56458.1 hypothetical protein Cspa_c26930 [Clostridium saccharoperbutylacetonicum N1-4(HMT)]NRT62795.1 hypothetical protein [Clostridium saccharoperbutylacetonicum]NSB26149.1 hypothetical protein [Clostridium saccharoperbutylacetonicum]NSB45502.1 hypothetical protein [Clostridium saccharoperbutylacetonicum]
MDLTIEQKKAIVIIRNYLNVDGDEKFTDEYILNNFECAIVELIESAADFKKTQKSAGGKGVYSASQGQRSVTLKGNVGPWTITDDIKSLLPLPYAKIRG